MSVNRALRIAFLCLFVFGLRLPAFSQANTGELRLRITDPDGAALRGSVQLASAANHYSASFTADAAGAVTVKGLPYGIYRLTVQAAGFGAVTQPVDIHSALPVEQGLMLRPAASATVNVSAQATLLDPYQPGAVERIGTQAIDDRVGSLPGRSVQDLVNTEPGWLYEGNAVLHPRGSEYQTQMVIDGMPLTDNRSPGFGPEVEADDIESMSIYTAGLPAEYGRKTGGVVEINTRRETRAGVHGQLTLSGGSYDTAGSYGELEDVVGRNTFGATASGSVTAHYLNPVVPENYTNRGTVGDFSLLYDGDITNSDRLTASVRHSFSHFEIPNELLQQQAGQLQTGYNAETMGAVHYQHTYSEDVLLSASGMVRANTHGLDSNDDSTPIYVTQANAFQEGYVKAALSVHRGHQEWKAGIESDATMLHENFNYAITDPTQFDPSTPATFAFADRRPDLEQAGFIEDLIRLGNWTVSAGLRWDHYQLLLNQNAFSPRFSLARYFAPAKLVLHASFDRIFQTPSSDNILVSSSSSVSALDSDFLREPVQPSRGNYYEGGASRAFGDALRLDVNVYRRDVRNYADDDQLLNTAISYPLAFDRSVIYGAEGKLDLVRWGRLSGFVSYSYMVGAVWYPVTGGLFLGDDADAAAAQLSGHFPDSQDQRNTLRTRFQYQAAKRLWLAAGADYNSGLPFDFGGDQSDALMNYGANVVDRLNFDRGRVDPQLSVNASAGATLYHTETRSLRLQADGNNLTNRLNVIDFGGLFSGNAIGPARSYSLRLVTTF